MVFNDGNTAYAYANRCRWYRVPSTDNPRADQPGDPAVTSGWATKTLDLIRIMAQPPPVSYWEFHSDCGTGRMAGLIPMSISITSL